MLAQITLILLKESVHLIAHVKYIFSPLKKITEHDDVFERGTHNFETVLNVFRCLPYLLLFATYDFTFPAPFLFGILKGTFSKEFLPGRSEKKKIIKFPFVFNPFAQVNFC